MDRLVLEQISLRFSDKNGGTDFNAGIKKLNASLHKFQPDRVDFGIRDFIATGVDFFMRTYKEKVKQPYLPVPEDKISEPGYGLNITADDFDIRDANVTIENTISGMYYSNKVTHVGMDKAVFNLSKSLASADELRLDSSAFKYVNPKEYSSSRAKRITRR